MFKNIRHIHFVGIGGSGMSGIAEVLINLGYVVSGSDLQKGAVVSRLEGLGAKIYIGHKSSNLIDADVVVTSTAVSQKNPEVLEAHKNNIPVIPRIEMLAEIARLKYTIAIAGTHGKTTTSSLVGQVLKECGLDPTVIVGGRLKAVGTGGVLGKGDYLVAEADESDGSFLKLNPAIAVVTNIDNDHLDYYKEPSKIDEAFKTFTNLVPFYGTNIICGDDPRIKKILPYIKRRFETYGFDKKNNFQAVDIVSSEVQTRFQVLHDGRKLGTVAIALAGRHNVLNALAAVAVGLKVNLNFNQITRALEQFEGVGRRMEFKGNANGIVVLDDYGHHPTEILATLSAIKERWPKNRFVVAFQPHRFSRTKDHAKEFADSLRGADHVFLLPIYPAGEKPIPGISIKSISSQMKKKNWDLAEKGGAAKIFSFLKPGDIFLTLGAGDVWKLGENLVLQSSTLAAKIAHAIPSLEKRIKTEEPLSRHCTWAIGGPAEVFIEVNTKTEFATLIKICQESKVKFFILGAGSNVLLPDEGLRGVVIRLKGDFEEIQINGTRVKVGAGASMPKLARLCAKEGLSGVESLAGVPGTVGGGLMSNAGTKRGSIGDVVEEVEILKTDGTFEILPKEKISLRYRWSSLIGSWIMSAVLRLKPAENGSPMAAIKEELDYRQKTQPLGTKNVGSVFCNPPNQFAAKLIEEVGLKGHQIGRLRFSPKHANFMENLGGGTAKEAMELIHLAQKLVKKQFDIELSPEVKLIKMPALEKKP